MANLTIRARAIALLGPLAAHVPAAPWLKQEIWSYQAAPRLVCVTNASAAVSVDPRQAQVPEEWTALPAFALGGRRQARDRGGSSRGPAPDEANRLTLRREAWLDFGGSGWYARDFLGGTMVQGWRLDVAAPYTLERAEANGDASAWTRRNAAGYAWQRVLELSVSNGVRQRSILLAARASLRYRHYLRAAGNRPEQNLDTPLHFPFDKFVCCARCR